MSTARARRACMLRVATALADVGEHNKRALWRETGRRSQGIMGVEDKGAPAPGAGGDQCPRRRRAVAPGRRVRLPAHRHREAGNAPPTPLATFVLRRAHIALIRSFTLPSCFSFPSLCRLDMPAPSSPPPAHRSRTPPALETCRARESFTSALPQPAGRPSAPARRGAKQSAAQASGFKL